MQLLDEFREYLANEKRYSAHTVKAYLSDLTQFANFLHTEYQLDLRNRAADLAQIRPTLVRNWIGSLQLERKSIHRKLSAVRTFLRYHYRRGRLPEPPLLDLHLPKTPRRLPVVARARQLNTALDTLKEEAPSDFATVRDRLVLELLYGCGLRSAELLGLSAPDIQLHDGLLRVRGKGNKTRLVPLGKRAAEAIQCYENACTAAGFDYHTPFLRTNTGGPAYPKLVYNIVNRFLQTVEPLPQASPHVLRHAYATHLMENGAELNAVKELLGHSSLAATQVYLHASAKRLKDVHEQAHPKGKK